jgi:hypothetical protein
MKKKTGTRPEGVILNAPENIRKAFVKLGFATDLNQKVKSENTLVFVNNYKECLTFLRKQLKSVADDSVLWFAYPNCHTTRKGITRERLRTSAESFGITSVSKIIIDDNWTAERFRPIEKVSLTKAFAPFTKRLVNAGRSAFRAGKLEIRGIWMKDEPVAESVFL